ncbi:sensor histidine kinase [Dechloromonas sp. H13]|uniref:sensor histidine kinase n=1 Tax=Dechloromonas sp. H13 TaxID=2570193 RepID=UPI00129113FB|nr:PAS domain S-box protein [Dechloromonas sp. H13]
MRSLPPPVSTRRLRWFLALPKLGVVLLLAAVVALLWLLHQNEIEEERTSLIKDVLWLEQNLRFHLANNEEQFQQLAQDLGSQQDRKQLFRVRAGHMLKNNPDIVQIVWYDPRRRVLDALPAASPVDSELEAFGPPATQKAFELAGRLNKRVYSEPFFLSGNAAHFALAVPVFAERQLAGMLVVTYSIDGLLGNLVPWWFAEKYRVVVVDDNDVQFAAKSNIEGIPSLSYELPFEPPGYGLNFRVTSYQTPGNPLQRLLAGAILVLAAGVFWSMWIVRDLMRKRAKAEEALRAEHALRSAMEDSLTVGMRARDLTGKIIYVNPAFCRMTGFSSAELVDRSPPMPYWVPEQLDETMALHRAVLAGEAPPDGFEITFRRKDGEHFQALIYEAPLIDGNGRHTGWMASVLDVTERRRAEELARQQQEQLQFTSRLVTMGEMASTLAHELNQPLAAIASYNAGCLNLLANENFDPGDIRQALEKLGVQAQRAGRIIRRVHDFVRKSEPKRAPCNLGEIIEDCIGFVEAEARKRHVHLETSLPALPPVLADRLMLEQVLLNLIRNGMEAMSGTPENRRVLRVSATPGAGEVIVGIADNGGGIAPEIRDKLFTAFFTTKPEGMGVGLSICRSIIEFHRGRLWAEDNVQSPTGSGTIFHFTLPLESA